MKAKILPFMATLLLLGGGFAACDSNDDPLAEMFPDGIKPVIPDGKLGKELTDFFNKNSGRIIGSFFPFPADADPYEHEIWLMTDTCVMINSMEEFPTVDFRGESIEVPVIDFDAYTFVIGKYLGKDGGIFFISQSLVVEPDKATLNILLGDTGDGTDAFWQGRFWGLYPKIASKPIFTNVVYKK